MIQMVASQEHGVGGQYVEDLITELFTVADQEIEQMWGEQECVFERQPAEMDLDIAGTMRNI